MKNMRKMYEQKQTTKREGTKEELLYEDDEAES